MAIRRRIPCRPRMCIGMKVRFAAMNQIPKWILPSVSFRNFPVILGHQ